MKEAPSRAGLNYRDSPNCPASTYGLRRPASQGPSLQPKLLGKVQSRLTAGARDHCRISSQDSRLRSPVRLHYTPRDDAVRPRTTHSTPLNLGMCALPIMCGWTSVDRGCKIDPVPRLAGSRLENGLTGTRSGITKKIIQRCDPLSSCFCGSRNAFPALGGQGCAAGGTSYTRIIFSQRSKRAGPILGIIASSGAYHVSTRHHLASNSSGRLQDIMSSIHIS